MASRKVAMVIVVQLLAIATARTWWSAPEDALDPEGQAGLMGVQ